MKKENTFIPKNKEQANEIYNLFNNISSVTNLLKLSPEIGTDNEMLDGTNTINAITEAYNNALKKKYKLENSSFTINNPVDEIQRNISKEIVKRTLSAANNIYKGGQKAIQWGKDFKRDFPQIKQNFINKLDNDLNIPKKWNEALNADFSLGEFEINKPVKSINIDNNGNIETVPSKFKGYRNPLTKDNRIYSREDIGSFNTNEFNNNEPEIRAQWGKIGIPSNGELEVDRLNNNGTVFVKGYTRSDGSKVKSHYRAI